MKTFGEPKVARLIAESFILVKLEIEHEQEAAEWFATEAVPDT